MGAERHADEFEALSAIGGDHLAAPRLDHQLDFLGDDPPRRVIGQPLMGQGTLRPAGIGEAQSRILIGKIGRRDLDHAPVDPRLHRTATALGFHQFMHCAH